MQTSRATPIQVGAPAWQARRLNESILCALVAREWQWRGHSVVELALGPRPAWRQGSAKSAWMTEQRAEQTMRALEERLRQAERTVHARARLAEPLTPRLRYALAVHASALARCPCRDHPDCLRAEARVLEADAAAREQSAPPDEILDLRIAALRRRWEAAERSPRIGAAERMQAFRRLVEAAAAGEIRIARADAEASPARPATPPGGRAGGPRASDHAGRGALRPRPA
jgi:hypothetical protein